MSESNSLKSDIYQKIAYQLNGNKIKHSLLHGVSCNSNYFGRDIDLMIRYKDRKAVLEIIKRVFVASEIKYKVIHKSWAYWIIGYKKIESSIYDIEIDLLWNINYRFLKLTEPKLLSFHTNKNLEKRFFIDPWNPFVKMFLILFFSKRYNHLTEKRFKETIDFISINATNVSIIETRLESLKIDSNELLTAINKNDIDRIKTIRNEVRLASLFFNHFFHSICIIVISSIWKLNSIFCVPALPYFSLSEVDGVGKSTQLVLIEKKLGNSIFTKIIFKHWRPNLLKNISEIRKNSLADNKTYQIKNIPPRREAGKLGILRIFYYYIDFLIGYLLVDSKLRNGLNLVIYDRHFVDMIIDPVRFGIHKNHSIILQLLFYITPKPNYMLYLIGEPEEIFNRKGELSINEIRDQQFNIKKLNKLSRRIIIIRNADIDTTNNEILLNIYEIIMNNN
ncbi:MAG: hypothetical protein GYA14_01855 [Ignavibacteria bacterium]|nr:hypothetical protein [Ignavibacteria bacterium]